MEMMVVNTTDPMAGNETADRYGQCPRLSGRQLAAVAAYAERRPTRRGEVLYDQGEEGYDFVVVLDGRVAVLGGYGGEQQLVGVHGPGRFLGELGLLSGQGAVLAAVVLERGEVLVVPPTASVVIVRAADHLHTQHEQQESTEGRKHAVKPLTGSLPATCRRVRMPPQLV